MWNHVDAFDTVRALLHEAEFKEIQRALQQS